VSQTNSGRRRSGGCSLIQAAHADVDVGRARCVEGSHVVIGHAHPAAFSRAGSVSGRPAAVACRSPHCPPGTACSTGACRRGQVAATPAIGDLTWVAGRTETVSAFSRSGGGKSLGGIPISRRRLAGCDARRPSRSRRQSLAQRRFEMRLRSALRRDSTTARPRYGLGVHKATGLGTTEVARADAAHRVEDGAGEIPRRHIGGGPAERDYGTA